MGPGRVSDNVGERNMYCKTSSSTTARRRGATDNQAATLYFYPLSSLRAATISHSPKRQRGDEFTGPTVPALTLGAMWPPRNPANSFRKPRSAPTLPFQSRSRGAELDQSALLRLGDVAGPSIGTPE